AARLTGAVGGRPGLVLAGFDLGQVGSTVEEFFLESVAACFEPAGPAGADGYWPVIASGQAPFATRLVVCRPSDPGVFTGTVILEWLNVTRGFDAPAHWMLTHRQVVRAGWAWVGVSAQRAGIEGGSIFEARGGAARVEGGRSGPVRGAAPPGRRVQFRHLLPGRARGPRRRRAWAAVSRVPARGGPVPVSDPPGHLRQRGGTDGAAGGGL